MQAPLTGVDVAERTVRLGDGDTLPYDALVLATGAAAEPAFGNGHGFNWDDTCEAEVIGGLLRDLEEGYSQYLAIVIPPGPGCPLPAYELALLISADARGMGMNPEITLVTPEKTPLAIFGPRAVEVVAEELKRAGVQVELGAYAELDPGTPGTIVMRPSGRRLQVARVLALPCLRGRAPEGIPADPDGFVSVDAHGRLAGTDGIRAAGDGIDFPVKFGGLAAEQADAAAADTPRPTLPPRPERPRDGGPRGRLPCTGSASLAASSIGDLWGRPQSVVRREICGSTTTSLRRLFAM